MKRNFLLRGFLTLTLLISFSAPVLAVEVELTPVKDNTIYESASGSLSNGQGDSLFAGLNGAGGGNRIMRGLIAFDLSTIPEGSMINSVTLTLTDDSPVNHGIASVTLHRLTRDWGEGSSHAVQGEAGGAASTANDATWIHTFFNSSFWDTAGGDFVAGASASQSVSGNGSYTWGSTAQLVADVQGWVDNPSNNFGWFLRGDEAGSQPTAKRFDSKDGNGNPPLLTVDYTAPETLTEVDEFYFPLFGDGEVPGILFQTSLLLTNTGADATVTLEAISRQGVPLVIDLGAGGSGTMIEIPLSRGQAYSAQSSGEGDPFDGDLQLGYVVAKVLRDSASALQEGSTEDVGGTAVFTRTQTQDDVVLYEAGVPATRTLKDFTVFLDSLGKKDVGLAIVNPKDDDGSPSGPASLTLRVWDKAFESLLATAQIQIEDGSAIGSFIWEIFRDAGAAQQVVDQLRETEAVVTVESDQDVAAVTLRQNDDLRKAFPEEVPTLTTFPVIEGRADESLVLAQ